jgi:hypothetical protein
MKGKVELVMELIEFGIWASFCGLTKLCWVDDWKQAWKSIENFCWEVEVIRELAYVFIASRTSW